MTEAGKLSNCIPDWTLHWSFAETIQFCNVVVIESLLSRDVRKPQHDVTDVTRPSLHSERKISIYSSVCSFSFSHSVILC